LYKYVNPLTYTVSCIDELCIFWCTLWLFFTSLWFTPCNGSLERDENKKKIHSWFLKLPSHVFLKDITSTPYSHIPTARSCCRCLQLQMKVGNVIKGGDKHSECIMHTLGAISGKNTVKPARSWSQNTCAQFENIYSYSLFLTFQSWKRSHKF
jgi:hypothetical protein